MEITEGVMEIAASIEKDIPSKVGGSNRVFIRAVIARAIMAERDACAKVAMGFVKYSYTDGGTAVNPYTNAMDVAAAIRNRP